MKKHHLSLHKFSLTAPYDVLRLRVEKRDNERGKVFDRERFDVIYKALQVKPFDDFCMIDSYKLSPEEMLKAVLSKV